MAFTSLVIGVNNIFVPSVIIYTNDFFEMNSIKLCRVALCHDSLANIPISINFKNYFAIVHRLNCRNCTIVAKICEPFLISIWFQNARKQLQSSDFNGIRSLEQSQRGR